MYICKYTFQEIWLGPLVVHSQIAYDNNGSIHRNGC